MQALDAHGDLYNRLLWTMDGSLQEHTAKSYTQLQELVVVCRQAEAWLASMAVRRVLPSNRV